MPFIDREPLRHYCFESLADAGVLHAVITRHGGVSQAPWKSMNLGGTVGDDTSHVMENRRRAFRSIGRSIDTSFDVWQVHSADVICAEHPRSFESQIQQADAIITDRPGITLFMRFADCVPILVYDPVRKAAGLIHAGWQGTVKKIARASVEAMQARYGSRPENLLAAIGPSIGRHHYPVGEDVIQRVRMAFGDDAAALMTDIPEHGEDGQNKVQFDLWSANRVVLEQAGVRQVEVAGLCTVCNMQDWYSHRGEQGKTGRFGVLIGL